MTRDAVLDTLRAHEDALRKLGVQRAALFAAPVDVAERSRLVGRVRETAERDAVYAF